MATPATIPGYSADKCHKRNSIAAKRDGVEAAPVRLFKSAPALADGQTLKTAKGKLPEDDAAALATINAGLAADSMSLSASDVYIHYIEAANSNFIGDRFMFLDASTLRNIASDATDGFAFMNSHRTGSLSHPSELPFGKTFAGRFEQGVDADGNAFQRTVAGFYMLAGIAPNGDSGPSTDALHAMIDGGTIFDVSVGLWGGDQICDVCGEDLTDLNPNTDGFDDGDYLCSHVPGTTHAMTADEIAAQKARGVPDGVASYTLVNAHCGEVSAVFDGAVPGAGFRKALSFSRRHDLSVDELAQARQSYAGLAGRSDFADSDGLLAQAKSMIADVFKDFGLKPQATPKADDLAPVPAAPGTTPAATSGIGDDDTMSNRLELSGAFSKLGQSKLAGAVAGAADDNPETIAKAIADQHKSDLAAASTPDANRSASEDDIIRLVNGENITNSGDLSARLAQAKLGDAYELEVRKEAKKQAVRAFGPEIGKSQELSCDKLPVLTVKAMSDGWKLQADKQFGFGKDGEPPARASVPGHIPVALSAEDQQGTTSDADVAAEAERKREELKSLTPVGRSAKKLAAK